MPGKVVPLKLDSHEGIVVNGITINGKRYYSAEEVREILTKKWQKEFGELRDDSVGRDGYFVIGFVNNALKDK